MFFLAGFLTDFPPFRHIRYCGHNHRERMKQMKKMCFRIAALALLAVVLAGSAFAAQVLVPVGQAVGLALETDGLTVAGFDEELGQGAKTAGLKPGDVIIQADGQPVTHAEALRALTQRAKEQIVLTVLRNGCEENLTVPLQSDGANKRLGVLVREGITGVGTVTYYDPSTGAFGALGHGVGDGQGTLLPLHSGKVLAAQVASVKKGRVGTPGQLMGAFQETEQIGELCKNTPCGVFGTSASGWSGIALPVAETEQMHTGPAVILSNVSGTQVQEYSVEILKLYPGEKACGRNMLLHVTDPELLEATGGIVQGMSGSPILQDGRIIGAVTHVLVNDPTTGYGIFIENMLEAAA